MRQIFGENGPSMRQLWIGLLVFLVIGVAVGSILRNGAVLIVVVVASALAYTFLSQRRRRGY